ncbi:YncE family protein [Clostridium sp. YIM B02551]|uniref:YncE family protein n=1 Tax=Clostridium sp. YIM B02551 TaxID=2910679 RepID=UPI001EE9DEDC|nr:YncE family protein [Clostridium sp. YIM B02551]
MEGLCICNTASNSLSFIDLNNYKHIVCPIVLGECPSGPHGLCLWGENIITANSYGDSLSVVSIRLKKEMENLYIGSHPNDIKVYRNKGYVLCGESNSLIIIDLISKKIMKEISLGVYPHFMYINKSGKAAIVNMDSNEITIFDCNQDEKIINIQVEETPTKCYISKNDEEIYVCESNLGLNRRGSISIYDFRSGKKVNEYKVGFGPVDFYYSENYIYVSNFEEGTVGFIDVDNEGYTDIKIGGMPRGIIEVKDRVYVADNFKNKLYIINKAREIEKTITLGKEPNDMVYYNLLD